MLVYDMVNDLFLLNRFLSTFVTTSVICIGTYTSGSVQSVWVTCNSRSTGLLLAHFCYELICNHPLPYDQLLTWPMPLLDKVVRPNKIYTFAQDCNVFREEILI